LWRRPLYWLLSIAYSSQSEKVNYIKNQGKSQFSNNSYPNFYNQGWRQNNVNYGKRQEHGTLSNRLHQQQNS